MKQKSLKINAALNFIRTFVGLVFPLITFPYSSRILQPEGIGRVNFAQSIVSYFALIASLGITNYGIREASKIRDDKIKLSQFSKELLTINLISTFIAYILFAIALVLVPKFYEYKSLLCICSASILFTTLGMDWLYTAIEDFEYITIRSIVFQIISVILLFTLVKTKDDYLKYAGIAVFSSVGSNLLNFIHSRKIINFKECSRVKLKQHLHPIFVLFAMAVTIQVYTVLDTTMLGFISGEWHVGIYSAATKINKIILSAVVAVSSVMLPRLSYYSSKEDKTEFTNLAYKGLDFLLLISIPCTIGLCILSREVILILSGNEYLSAISSMRIMNPIIIIIGLSNFLGIQIFMPLNMEKNTLYSVITGAVINFILNLILIPKYQAFGAAVATLCAELMVTLVQFYFAHQIISYRYVLKRFIIYFFNSLVMLIPVIICKYYIKSNFLILVFGIMSGALMYFSMLVIEKNQIMLSVLNTIKNRIKK